VRGEEADDIEQWLSREFESPAKEPLEKVLADKEPTDEDWRILVRFLASQIIRTPAFLINNLPRWNQIAPRVLDQTLKDVEARLRAAKKSGQEIGREPAPHTEYFPMRIDRKDLPEEKKVQFTTRLVVARALVLHHEAYADENPEGPRQTQMVNLRGTRRLGLVHQR
jgi:hypothetical protein